MNSTGFDVFQKHFFAAIFSAIFELIITILLVIYYLKWKKAGGIFYLDKCLATLCKMQLVSIEYENEFHKFFNVKRYLHILSEGQLPKTPLTTTFTKKAFLIKQILSPIEVSWIYVKAFWSASSSSSSSSSSSPKIGPLFLLPKEIHSTNVWKGGEIQSKLFGDSQ